MPLRDIHIVTTEQNITYLNKYRSSYLAFAKILGKEATLLLYQLENGNQNYGNTFKN